MDIFYCKAIRHEGKAKGKRCENSISLVKYQENGYCDRHQRNKMYDEGIKNGTRWCRMFWRGCENEICNDNININQKTCDQCNLKLKEKFKKGKETCKKENCNFKEKEGGYCGKHSRQIIIDKAKEEGKELCDPARGCFNYLQNGKRKCTECRDKENKRDKELRDRRKEKNIEDQAKKVCLSCGNSFNEFMTRHNKSSTKCLECYNKQKVYEEQRQITRRSS
jgi:hypothetical protein